MLLAVNPDLGDGHILFLAFSLELLLATGLEFGHSHVLVVIDLVDELVKSSLLVFGALVVIFLLTRSRHEH